MPDIINGQDALYTSTEMALEIDAVRKLLEDDSQTAEPLGDDGVDRLQRLVDILRGEEAKGLRVSSHTAIRLAVVALRLSIEQG